MDTDNKMDLTMTAANAILDTFGIGDWIGIVDFDSTARAYSTSLVRGTSSNKKLLKAYVN